MVMTIMIDTFNRITSYNVCYTKLLRLLCSVILLMFTDRAFGWQSSLVDAPAKVEQIVRWVSAPWSWALPEQTALPTREQIEGSKIILRESRTQLASENLLAWWPFLILFV